MVRRDPARTVVMELSMTDIKELHLAVRERSAKLKKAGGDLRKIGRDKEADSLEATVTDLNERLATQFAAEMDPTPEIGKADGTDDKGGKPPKKEPPPEK